MINFIKRCVGVSASTHQKVDTSNDDFADFFYNAKASEKKKLMNRVMKRATQSQLDIIKRAKAL